MSNQFNSTDGIKPGILPDSDSLWVVFVPVSYPPYCFWFDSKEMADKFYSESSNGNITEPIKYTKDF